MKIASLTLYAATLLAAIIIMLASNMNNNNRVAATDLPTVGNRVVTLGNWEMYLDDDQEFLFRDKALAGSTTNNWNEWCSISSTSTDARRTMVRMCQLFGFPVHDDRAIYRSTAYRSSSTLSRRPNIYCPPNFNSLDDCTIAPNCSSNYITTFTCNGMVDYNPTFTVEPKSGRILVDEVNTGAGVTVPKSTLCNSYFATSSSYWPERNSFGSNYAARMMCKNSGFPWSLSSMYTATYAFNMRTQNNINISAYTPWSWNMVQCNTSAYTTPGAMFKDNCLIGAMPGDKDCQSDHSDDLFANCNGDVTPHYSLTRDSNNFLVIHNNVSTPGMGYLCDKNSGFDAGDAEALCYIIYNARNRSFGATFEWATLPSSYSSNHTMMHALGAYVSPTGIVSGFRGQHAFDQQDCMPNRFIKLLCPDPTVSKDWEFKRDPASSHVLSRPVSLNAYPQAWRPYFTTSTPSTNTQKYLCAKLGEPTNYTSSFTFYGRYNIQSAGYVNGYTCTNAVPTGDFLDDCSVSISNTAGYTNSFYFRTVVCSATSISSSVNTKVMFPSTATGAGDAMPRVVVAQERMTEPVYSYCNSAFSGVLASALCVAASGSALTKPAAPWFHTGDFPLGTTTVADPRNSYLTCNNGIDNITNVSTECVLPTTTTCSYDWNDVVRVACANTDTRELGIDSNDGLLTFRPNASVPPKPICYSGIYTSTANIEAHCTMLGVKNVTTGGSYRSRYYSKTKQPLDAMMNQPYIQSFRMLPNDISKYTFSMPSLCSGTSSMAALACVNQDNVSFWVNETGDAALMIKINHLQPWEPVTYVSSVYPTTYAKMNAEALCQLAGKPSGYTKIWAGDYISGGNGVSGMKIDSSSWRCTDGNTTSSLSNCTGTSSYIQFASDWGYKVHLTCLTARPPRNVEWRLRPNGVVQVREYSSDPFAYICGLGSFSSNALKNICNQTGRASDIASKTTNTVSPGGNTLYSDYECATAATAPNQCTLTSGDGSCSATSSWYRLGVTCRGPPTKTWQFKTLYNGLLLTRADSSSPWGTVGVNSFGDDEARTICQSGLGAAIGTRFTYSSVNLRPSGMNTNLDYINCYSTSTNLNDCSVEENGDATSTIVVSLWCNIQPQEYDFMIDNTNNNNLIKARVATGNTTAPYYPICYLDSSDAAAICRRLGKPWKAAYVSTFSKTLYDDQRFLFAYPQFSTATATKDNLTYVQEWPSCYSSSHVSLHCVDPVFLLQRATDGTVYLAGTEAAVPQPICMYSYSTTINPDINAGKVVCSMLGKGSNNIKMRSTPEGIRTSSNEVWRYLSCPNGATTFADCTYSKSSCYSYLQVACDGEDFPIGADPNKNTRVFKLERSTSDELQVFTRATPTSSWGNLCRYGYGSDNFDKYMCRTTGLPWSSAYSSTASGNSTNDAEMKFMSCKYSNISNPAIDCGYLLNTTWCTSNSNYEVYCNGNVGPISGADSNTTIRHNATNGFLEVKFKTESKWGYIAYSTSSTNNHTAQLLCKSMSKPMTEAHFEASYNTGNLYPSTNYDYPYETMASYLQCSSADKSIEDCEIRYRNYMSTTTRRNIVKLVCAGDLSYQWSFKINGTRNILMAKSSASAPWGTVTYYNSPSSSSSGRFGSNAAISICNMIKNDGKNYTASSFSVGGSTYYTDNEPSSIPVAMSDIACYNRGVSDIEQCAYQVGCGYTNCNHIYDMSLHCREATPTYQYRLVSWSGSTTARKVEMRVNNGAWKGVCGTVTTNTARALCSAMGLASSSAYDTTTTSQVVRNDLGFSNLYCASTSYNVNNSQCSVREDIYSGCSGAQLAVYCSGSVVSNWQASVSGSNNQVRFRDGNTGSWQTFCPPSGSWSYNTMYTICRAIGNTSISSPKTIVINGESPSPSLKGVSCSFTTSGNVGQYCTVDDGTTNCASTHTVGLYCRGSDAPGQSATATPSTNSPTAAKPIYRIESDMRVTVRLPGRTDYGSVCDEGAGSTSSSRKNSRYFATEVCQSIHNDQSMFGYYWSNANARPSNANMNVAISNVQCGSVNGVRNIDLCTYDSTPSSISCQGHNKDVFIFCARPTDITGYDTKLARDGRVLIKPTGPATSGKTLPWGSGGCAVKSWTTNGVAYNPETSSTYDTFPQVVCRATGRLDVSNAQYITPRYSSSYPSDMPVYGSNFYKCKPGSKFISDCSVSPSTCSHSSDIFVSCGAGANYAAGYFFKIGTNNLLQVRATGSSVWGTVDASGYSSQALTALCAAATGMATSNVAVNTSTKSFNSGPTYLRSLTCPAGETNLAKCSFSKIATNTVTKASSITCGAITSGTWKIRLGAANRLEMLPSGTGAKWTTVCSSSVPSATTTQYLCKFLGYSTSVTANATASALTKTDDFLPYYTSFSCNSLDNDVSQCYRYNSTSTTYASTCPYTAVALNCLGTEYSPSAAAAGNDPSSGNSPGGSSGGGSAGAAAGGAVGGLIFLALIALVIFFVMKKQKENQNPNGMPPGTYDPNTELAMMNNGGMNNMQQPGGAVPYQQMGSPNPYGQQPQAAFGAPAPMQSNYYPTVPQQGGGGYNPDGGIVL